MYIFEATISNATANSARTVTIRLNEGEYTLEREIFGAAMLKAFDECKSMEIVALLEFIGG